MELSDEEEMLIDELFPGFDVRLSGPYVVISVDGYRCNLNFEMLEKISKTFKTKKINLYSEFTEGFALSEITWEPGTTTFEITIER